MIDVLLFISLEAWIGVLLLIAVTMVGLGARRYQDLFNPLSWFGLFEIGLLSAVSSILCYVTLGQNGYGDEILALTLGITAIYAASVCGGHYIRFQALDYFIESGMRILCGSGGRVIERRHIVGIGLIFSSIGLFVLMAFLGGGGELWLYAPRDAYLNNRSGVGFLWAISNWLLILSMTTWLWGRPVRVTGTALAIVIYAFLLFFWGSKAAVLSAVVLGVVTYHYRVKPISVFSASAAFGSVFLLFFILLMWHGSDQHFSDPIYYFHDYINTTAMALGTPGLMDGTGNGMGHLSSLWQYVPRAIVPEKPFEYGVLLIHRELFPGMAEVGSTPGFVAWTLAYYDFGLTGVVLAGLLTGMIQRVVYSHFLGNKNPATFVFYMQFALFPVFLYAFALFSFAICMMLNFLSNLEIPDCDAGLQSADKK